MAILVRLGNPNPIAEIDPDYTDEITTDAVFPDEMSVDEVFITITDPDPRPMFGGVWVNHSHDPAPSWVACSDADLEARLASHYGCGTKEVPGVNA